MECVRLGAALVELGLRVQLADRLEKLQSARETADRRLLEVLRLKGQAAPEKPADGSGLPDPGGFY